jgi:hypothetical protein
VPLIAYQKSENVTRRAAGPRSMPTFDATFDAREQINEKLPTNGDDGFGATALAVMPAAALVTRRFELIFMR